MPKPQIITGLDIGTNTIKMLVVAKHNGDPDFEVISFVKEPAFGVRRGIVINTDNVSNIVQALLEKARLESGQKINSAFINIGGSHIFSTFSRGTVAVSRADRKVSEEDVNRVVSAAQTFSLPSNKEIFEVFPKEFIIDDERGIKEAVGMEGVRLETEVLVLAGFSPYKTNLSQAVLGSDLQVSDIILSPLASGAATLTKKQKELGVAILDIGAGTSDLAVFEEGELVHLAIIPMGSANITNDIAIGLKTDIDTAELIKIEKGTCSFKGREKKEKIEIEGEEPLNFSQKMLSRIIEARLSEIFGEVQKELKNVSKQGLLPAGLVLTGGGVKMPGVVELAKREFKLPCRLGRPLGFPGLEDDPSLATVCGLVASGAEPDESGRITKNLPIIGGGIGDKIKKAFKVFIP